MWNQIIFKKFSNNVKINKELIKKQLLENDKKSEYLLSEIVFDISDKEKSEANAHDILLCIKEGEKLSTPIGKGRGFRYGLPNQEYYYKSSDEMKSLFRDYPESIINIQEVIDKIEIYYYEGNYYFYDGKYTRNWYGIQANESTNLLQNVT